MAAPNRCSQRTVPEDSGGDGDGEMGHTIVEAVQEVSDNRFDDCRVIVLACEGLDGGECDKLGAGSSGE